MKITGHAGITVHQDIGTDSESYQIVLDSDTRDLLDYIREIRQMTSHYTGFNFATNLMDLEEDINMIKSWYLDEKDLRENNPAVIAAWEHYQMMVALAKQDKNQ